MFKKCLPFFLVSVSPFLVQAQLQDPSFEQGDSHWRFTCPDDGSFPGTTAPGGGTYCAQVTMLSTTQPDCYHQNGTFPFVYQELPGVQNGDHISLTFWHRGIPTPPTLMGSVHLLVSFGWWDPPLVGMVNGSCGFIESGTYDAWQPDTFQCTLSGMPPGATAAIFLGGQATNNGNGAIQFDLASVTVTSPGVTLAADAFLDGPYDTNTGLMRDDLRTAGLLPLSEPYSAIHGGTGGESVAPAVLAFTGANAIVDWVRLELRSGTSSSTTVAVRHALVQRDGDIVDTDGTSPVVFDAPPGSYRVVLRHRNHLGVMTANALAFGPSTVPLDLRAPATACYTRPAPDAGEPRRSIGNTRTLWAGDVGTNGTVSYTGFSNDRDPVLVAIGGSVATNTINGQYRMEDTNMNGTVSYTGANNDRDLILQSIGGVVATNVRIQQLP